jgi:hypothetical protein
MRIRTTFRARKSFGGLHLNFGKRGLTSVSATVGPSWLPVTVNPSRRSVSIDTPGPGSLRLIATPEEAQAEAERTQLPPLTTGERLGLALGRGLNRIFFGKRQL